MFDLLLVLLGALLSVLIAVRVAESRARYREFRREAEPMRRWIDRQLSAANLDHPPSDQHRLGQESAKRIEAFLFPWNRHRFRRLVERDKRLRQVGESSDPAVGIIRQYSNEPDIRQNLRRMRRFTVRR